MRWRKKDTYAVFIIIILGLLTYFSIHSYLGGGIVKSLFDGDVGVITSQIQGFGIWSYFIFFALIVMECVFAPFPPLILYIAGGTIFGGFVAGIIALAANVLGAAIAFRIAQKYGREKLVPRIPKAVREKFDKMSKKYGPLSIFILRFNPFTSSDLFSYLAGFTKMSFKKFLVATGLGLSLTVFIQTYLGEQIQSNPIIAKVSIIIGALYLFLFFAGYFFFKKKIKKLRIKVNMRRRLEKIKEITSINNPLKIKFKNSNEN